MGELPPLRHVGRQHGLVEYGQLERGNVDQRELEVDLLISGRGLFLLECRLYPVRHMGAHARSALRSDDDGDGALDGGGRHGDDDNTVSYERFGRCLKDMAG
jgi:hypothetical protein